MAYAKNKLEVMSDEAPFPAEVVEVGEEAVVLFVDVEDARLFPAVEATEPEPELDGDFDPLEAEAADEPELVDAIELLEAELGSRLAGSVTLAHDRLYNGDVPKVLSLVLLPRRPKLGFGAVGAASCRTYHQVLTLPKADAQPISSQNVCALAKLGTARF